MDDKPDPAPRYATRRPSQQRRLKNAGFGLTAASLAQTLEAQIVQDADRLDALGAVGIARCLMLGGEMGKPLYHPAEPLPHSRPPDDGRYVIDHFYRKLFKLADKMNTPSARQEALRRAAFMRHYLAELAREIGIVAE